MKNLLAQDLKIGTGNPFNIKGPLDLGTGDPSNVTIADLVNKLLTFLVPFAAVILFLVLVSGGFDYLMSQGDSAKVKSAQGKITAGILGFILLISSYLIVRVIEQIIFGTRSSGIF